MGTVTTISTFADMNGDDRPKWQQVLDDLEDRLASGDIEQRFPTDRELVERYDVSRHTVREAVRRLKARGIIERERGRGSIVRRPELVQRLGTLYSLFQAVEAQGMTQTSEVVAQDLRPDARAAEKLGVAVEEPLFHLERIRLADGKPLALDTAWLPADLGRPLLDVDFTHTALYDELRERTGVRPTSGEEAITPVVPGADLRDLLDLDAGEAVLRVQRTSRAGDRTIECRVTLVHGSRFTLVSRWPDDGVVRPELTQE